jgi:sugar lactone lactonase YvrE
MWPLIAVAIGMESQVGATAKMEAQTSLRMRAQRAQQYLLISSPKEMKVCYSIVTPGKSGGTPVEPIIDSGLVRPEGIAVDRVRGKLYIADPAAQKIYQYSISLSEGLLVSDNKQITIVQGIESAWVAVDHLGDLYFTDTLNNRVMSVELAVIQKLETGEITASGLKTASEQAEMVKAEAAKNAALASENLPTAAPAVDAIIHVIYSKEEGAETVSAPAGIVSDGITVFWGNAASGTSMGSVISGPRHPSSAQPSKKLEENTNKVFGMATSSNALFYADNTQYVYGVRKAGGTAVTMISSMQAPRGLAWDGDGTIFVADQAGSMVYSFPSGRLAGASTTRVTQLHDAFGLALVSADDAFAAFAARHFLTLLFATWLL